MLVVDNYFALLDRADCEGGGKTVELARREPRNVLEST